MTDLILRIAMMMDYLPCELIRDKLVLEGHTEENVFLAMKAAEILHGDRA